MKPATWGLIAGLAVWLVEVAFFSFLVERMKRAPKGTAAEKQKTILILRGVSAFDLFLYPAIGWFVAPFLVPFFAEA